MLVDQARPVIGLGTPSSRELLAMPGVVVSGHIGRNVSRVLFGDEVAYLKREHRVRLRDRFRSLLAGFGRASLSQREYLIIRRLREHGLPAPQLLANGEYDGQAFLLVAQAVGAVELRQLDEIGVALADKLGRIVARIHNVGVDQPDLFAKHFLVNPFTEQITILDWQRATLRDSVPIRNRIHSLAAFRATSSDALLPQHSWHAFLAAYVSMVNGVDREWLEATVSAKAKSLRRRPSIRAQLVAPVAEQELVRLAGETVCAIPSIAGELESPEVIERLYDPAYNARELSFAAGTGTLQNSNYRFSIGRLWSRVRGKTWRSKELRTARLLFHLERFGITAAKLLAYGQRINRPFAASAFVLSRSIECDPPTFTDADRLRILLNQLHAAGCQLRGIGDDGELFGMKNGVAIVRDISRLRLNRRLSVREMARDRARLEAWLGGPR